MPVFSAEIFSNNGRRDWSVHDKSAIVVTNRPADRMDGSKSSRCIIMNERARMLPGLIKQIVGIKEVSASEFKTEGAQQNSLRFTKSKKFLLNLHYADVINSR